MSETTSAPAPAGSGDAATAAPPPNTQPQLSISEAGRLLNQQRRAAAPDGNASPAPVSKPSANELAQQAKDAAAAPPAAATPSKAATGLSAMERALGVPGVAPPDAAAAPTPAASTPAPANGAAIEIEGEHYTPSQLREFVLKATDYTKKTQELAQQRQQVAAQQQALATVLPYIQPELQRLAESLQRADAAAMPDPSLALSDPTSYVQQRAAYDAAVAEQQRLGNLSALQQQAHQRAMEQRVAEANQQLAAEYPFWADPAERLQAQQQIVDWATTKGGFTRDELKGLADARYLKAMMKARAYDHWVEGAKTSAPTPQLQAPPRGSPPPAPPTARVQDAQQRFEAKPDWRSGAALLGAMRAAKR
jgi:hypothetical protein